jgi:hypothetical protein
MIRQHLQVQDVAAGLIDLAGHHHLQDVIVPVQIRALPEQPPVLLIRQARVIQLMRGIERFAAADQHRHRARRGLRPAAAKPTALYA